MSTTLILIAITCAVSFTAMNNPKMIDALILWPPAVNRRKEYYRLISYGLIHADFMHLLFNMLTLYFFGRVLEGVYNEAMGPFGFALFYIGGLLVSILPSYHKHRNDNSYFSLGASGAISGVLGAYILLFPTKRVTVLLSWFITQVPAFVAIGLWFVFQLISGLGMLGKGSQQGGVAYAAHIGGFIAGLALIKVFEFGRPRLNY